jgi:hypothetical protein
MLHLCINKKDKKDPVMMKEMDLREITNAKIGARLKQVLILIAVILIGILISIATQAESKPFKIKFGSNNATSLVSHQDSSVIAS